LGVSVPEIGKDLKLKVGIGLTFKFDGKNFNKLQAEENQ
jgi:hypothetical protein